MSVSDDAHEILEMVSRYRQAKTIEQKRFLLDNMEKANMRIQSALSAPANADFYRSLLLDPPPARQKHVKTPKKRGGIVQKPQFHAATQPALEQTMSTVQTSQEREWLKPLSPKEKKQLMKELAIDEKVLKRSKKRGKKNSVATQGFTVYSSTPYGKLANQVFGDYVDGMAARKTPFYKSISEAVKNSGMPLLSKTYVAMLFFTTVLAGLVGALFSGLVAFGLTKNLTVTILALVFGGLGIAILTYVIMYVYPSSRASSKSRIIDGELPFMIIHMAAIASSGAQPDAMFRLLLRSGEYKGVESEIKKIVNYVNLFGYDLSTALKSVTLRTPSKRLKDLLSGIASTIESGGNLKSYLNSAADDTMSTYKLERKKYTQVLSTYSDIYTGVLIAAPLLFIVTLAIINVLGGTIGGVPLSVVAMTGTFVVLPIINIAFYLFLSLSQPEQ